MQDRWSRGERLADVRGGRERARKCAAMGNCGAETASLMAWPLFKASRIACHNVACSRCQVSVFHNEKHH